MTDWEELYYRKTLNNSKKNTFTYNKYDKLSRIIEGGQKKENTNGTEFRDIFGDYVQGYYNPDVISNNNINTFINNTSGVRTEVSKSYYDELSTLSPSNFIQQNIRKRLVAQAYYQVYTSPNVYDHSTHFSYDIHGNTNNILQDYPIIGFNSQRFKKIEYEYDILSGLTIKATYQKGEKDEFIHLYHYDNDNRLDLVETSDNGLAYNKEIQNYFYQDYMLARTEIGENLVQGEDFTYTIQGWIKGLNSASLDAKKDPGNDGDLNTNIHQNFAKDACAYVFKYFDNDYRPIDLQNKWQNTLNRFEPVDINSNLRNQSENNYTGNISHSTTTIRDSATLFPLPSAFTYQYDELDRLIKANSWNNLDLTTNQWASGTADIHRYENKFRYDGNGNIEYQERRNNQGHLIDQLVYNYNVSGQNSGSPKKLQNRLYFVNDVINSTDYSNDIDDQASYNQINEPITTGSNYQYNAVGELAKDLSENIDTILWKVNGSIKEIRRVPGSNLPDIKFNYDSKSNRIAKHLYSNAGSWIKSTYYVRNQDGIVLAIYEKKKTKNPIQIGSSNKQLEYKLSERSILGSKRIGKYAKEVSLIGSIKDAVIQNESAPISIDGNKFTNISNNTPIKPIVVTNKKMPLVHSIGDRHYELINPLRNVISVVSDKKIAIDDGAGNVSHYMPDILSAKDYSPFGVPLEGRNYNKKAYRYSFQGQEHDDEIKGNGNSINFTYRMHDPRLGRFLSLDPLESSFTWNSPYAFSANVVTNAIEMEGAENFFITGTNSDNTRWTSIGIPSKESSMLVDGLSKYTKSSINETSFNWNEDVITTSTVTSNSGITHKVESSRKRNYTFNNEEDRKIAAGNLVNHILDFRREQGIDEYDENGQMTVLGAEPITLIGHSHGGNVSIQAAKMLYDEHGIQLDLITIATPTYKGTAEDPSSNPGIAHHLHIFNDMDGVQGALAGGDTYPWSRKTSTVKLDPSKYYWKTEWMDAHSFDNQHPRIFLLQLQENAFPDLIHGRNLMYFFRNHQSNKDSEPVGPVEADCDDEDCDNGG
jgi:RHS repeat-associated protein